MPSTYSNIKIQLMATGENNTTWGNVTNINLGTAIEEAIVGSADVTFASGNVTLTLTDTNASQTARHMRLRCTGTTGGSTRNLVVPSVEKPYIVQNDCLNSIVVKTAAGTGITVPAGKTMWVYSDGVNVVDVTTHLSSLTLGTDLAVSDGGTGASTFTANGIIYGNTTSALLATAAGTTGQVLVGNTGGAPSWATLSGIGVTSFSAGTTGLTPSSATSGAITLAGTLNVANGGTGATSLTSGYLVKGNGTSAVTSSTVYDNGTNVGIATSSPTERLTVAGNTKVGEGVAGNTSKLMVNTLSGVAAGIQLFQDANESWIIQNPASTNVLTFSASGNERMRITSAGDVGIGTSSPAQKFVISNAGAAGLEFDPTAGLLQTYNRATSAYTNMLLYALQQRFFTGASPTERMRIDSAGNLLVGTTFENGILSVVGNQISVGTAGGSGSLGIQIKGTTLSGIPAAQVQAYIGTGDSTMGSAGDLIIAPRTDISCSIRFVTGTTPAERVRIDGAGNVGIGTAAPGYKLSVDDPGTGLGFTNAAGGNFNIGLLAGTLDPATYIYQRANSSMFFGTNNATRMTISNTGNVGIGTTSPLYVLNTNYNANATFTNAVSDFTQMWQNSGTNALGVALADDLTARFVANNGYSIAFNSAASEFMRITSAGNVGIGTASPTQKLEVNGSIAVAGVGNAITFDTTGAAQANYVSTVNNFDIRMVCGRGSTSNFTAASDNANIQTNGSERMRVDAFGNVMVGTTAANSKFLITYANPVSIPAAGAGGHALAVGTVGYGLAAGAITNGNAYLQATRWDTIAINYDLLLQPNGGNVGIGTTTPGGKLEVLNNGTALRLNTTFVGGNIVDLNPFVLGVSNDGFSITVGGTIRQVITGAGNVGIGTTSPSAQLHLAGPAELKMTNTTNTAGYDIGLLGGLSDANAYVYQRANAALILGTNNNDRMTITGAGDVGIGTSTPISKFELTSGYITSGTVSSIGGAKILAGQWSGTEHLTTFGSEYSSGGPALGYAVWPSSTTFGSFVSAVSVSLPRTAYVLSGSSHIWYTGGTQTVAVGSPVTMAETMRIDSAGLVGIGTTTPGYKLEVRTDGASDFNWITSFNNTAAGSYGAGYIARAGSNFGYFYMRGDGLAFVENAGANALGFATNGSERARIDSSGNFLVGKTSTSGGVAGFEASATGFVSTADGTFAGWMNRITSDGDILRFNRSATLVGSVSVTTTATAYNTSSDYRLKDIDGPIANSGAYIDALKPVQGSWKSDGSRFIGLLAHEVQEVSETPIATGEKDGDTMQAMDYSAPEIIANLIAEIQSLRARVAQLEGK